MAAYVALIFTWSSLADLAPPGDVTHLDKVAHSVEYGILGWLLARAWGPTLGPRRRLAGWVLAFVCGAGIGAVDERYQGTVGRSQSLGDWITDAVAVLVVAAITFRLRPGSIMTPPGHESP